MTYLLLVEIPKWYTFDSLLERVLNTVINFIIGGFFVIIGAFDFIKTYRYLTSPRKELEEDGEVYYFSKEKIEEEELKTENFMKLSSKDKNILLKEELCKINIVKQNILLGKILLIIYIIALFFHYL